MQFAAYNEWGKLHSVLLGIEDDTTEPDYIPALQWVGEWGIAEMKKNAGLKLREVHPERADAIRDQINGLADALEGLGVRVYRTTRMEFPEEKNHLADVQRGIHVWGGADYLRVIGHRIILINALRYPFRRKQAFVVRRSLEPLLKDSDAQYVAMPPPSPHYNEEDPFLENGDIMLDGYNVYVGISGNATNKAGVQWLKRYLGPEYRVSVVELASCILHLDTVLNLNRPGLLTWYPEFVKELPKPLRHWERIEVKRINDEPIFGANSLIVDENTIIVPEQYERVAREYETKGMRVITLPFDMTIIYGAGPRCLTGVLHRDP